MVLSMQKYLCATSFALLQVGFASTEELSTFLFEEEISPTPDGTAETEIPSAGTTAGHGENEDFETTNAYNDHEDDGLMRILMFGSPIIVLLLLIPLIYCIVKRIRWKKDEKDEDTVKHENIKSPIFEEDTPSVMEIEMEELDKWMNNMKENGKRLSVLEEEGKFQTSLSDNDHEDSTFDMADDCLSMNQKENLQRQENPRTFL